MPAGAVEQVALERLLDRLLAVEGDVVVVAAVGQQQARALQVTQRLIQPLVVEMAVRRAFTSPGHKPPGLSGRSTPRTRCCPR